MRLVHSLLACAMMSASAAGAATLPSGFSETQVATGFSNPTTMQFAPDGRLFVSEQGGRLRVVKDGALLPVPFVSVTVNSSGERGLLGIAFDPAFDSNHWVYVYYTATTPAIHNRISRFTANGDVAVAGSEVVIFDLDNLSSARRSASAHPGRRRCAISGAETASTSQARPRATTRSHRWPRPTTARVSARWSATTSATY